MATAQSGGPMVGKGNTNPTIASADVAQIVSRLTGLTTTGTTPNLMINKAELMTRLMVDATLNSNLWIKDSHNH